MTDVTFEILVILLLLLGNGYLALSEIAVVSARRPRLLQRAERGDTASRAAAELSQCGGSSRTPVGTYIFPAEVLQPDGSPGAVRRGGPCPSHEPPLPRRAREKQVF